MKWGGLTRRAEEIASFWISCAFEIANSSIETIKSHKVSNRNIKQITLSAPVTRALRELGAGISVARRRRRLTQASLAERVGASLSTVRRLERGDERVPVRYLARALFIFGKLDTLATLLDSARDEVGLAMAEEQLPRRVRARRATSGAL